MAVSSESSKLLIGSYCGRQSNIRIQAEKPDVLQNVINEQPTNITIMQNSVEIVNFHNKPRLTCCERIAKCPEKHPKSIDAFWCVSLCLCETMVLFCKKFLDECSNGYR